MILASTIPLAAAASMIAMSDSSARAGRESESIDEQAPHAAQLRAQGPAALADLLARYDRLQVGRERDQLAQLIDQVARQRYATVSRLYWYTDLAEARTAAQRSGRPILALRMLGNLDEELSCANSRLFRTVLYANTEVSKLMRDHFVLYWSSERPVPKVTIDMGDGRIIQRTTTGNSAHYVLDAQGNVLDVLPGLYAPKLFKAELQKSLALAASVKNAPAVKLNNAVANFHRTAMAERATAFGKLAGVTFRRDGVRSFPGKLERAQRATMSKAVMEMPDLHQFGIDAGKIERTDIEQWAAIAVRLWNLQSVLPGKVQLGGPAPSLATLYNTFDGQSLHLIHWLHDRGQPASTEIERNAMTARLEYSTLADSALDELQLRQQIRAKLVSQPGISLDELNAWIYAEVFHTPAADPWLGLVPRTDFTGLPGDGVSSRAAR